MAKDREKSQDDKPNANQTGSDHIGDPTKSALQVEGGEMNLGEAQSNELDEDDGMDDESEEEDEEDDEKKSLVDGEE